MACILAAILNIRRAYEAALNMGGQHLIRRERLSVPQSARNVFTLLAQADRIPDSLAIALRNRAGFRNIAVPDYQVLQLVVTVAAIEQHLDDFLLFSKMLLMHDKTSSSSYRQLLLIFVTYRLPHSNQCPCQA